jgi:hypothetical protein
MRKLTPAIKLLITVDNGQAGTVILPPLSDVGDIAVTNRQ